MKRRGKPEVLAPAGNLRGLKTAVDYGADAVYCGGKSFGMRSAPRNLSLDDFREGAAYAHERGARVYVTLNILPRNNEITAIERYIEDLRTTGVELKPMEWMPTRLSTFALTAATFGLICLIGWPWDCYKHKRAGT